MAKTSYQMLEVLSFSGRERALSLSMEISELTFVVKKSTMKLRICLFLEDGPCHGFRRHLDEYENLMSNNFRRTAVLKKI